MMKEIGLTKFLVGTPRPKINVSTILHHSAFDLAGWDRMLIIAEDHGTGYRFWITQSSRDMQVSYAKMTAQGNGPNLAYCQQCKKKSELAVIVSRLFAELDAAAAA